jgi:hypothetical protein
VGAQRDDASSRILRPPAQRLRRRLEGQIAIRPQGDDHDIVLIPATPDFFVRYRYL